MKKNNIIVCSLFFIFALIQNICLIPSGDDLIWAVHSDWDSVFGSNTENGRYFTNAVTQIVINSPLLISIIFTCVLYFMFVVLAKLIRSYFLSAFFIMTIPLAISSQTTMWISGFTNYVIGTLLCLTYILICFPLFEHKEVKLSKLKAFLMLPLGLLGAMCVENVTLFNLIFGVFIIIYTYVSVKKVKLENILYLVGTAVGTVIMFCNENYWRIKNDGHISGDKRDMNFSVSDISMKIYSEIIHMYAKPYFIVHIIIAGCILWKVSRAEKRGKYTLPCISAVIGYAMYSFFTYIFSDFEVLSPAYKVQSLETAFNFVYILSLIYLVFVFFERPVFVKFAVYIIGTLVLTAPFVMISPLNWRCFFTDYIFWCLAGGTVLYSILDKTEFEGSFFAKTLSVVCVGFFACVYGFMDISNKYCDSIRYKYINKQIEENSRTVNLVKLPYQKLVIADSILFLYESSTDEGDESQNDYYKSSLIEYKNIDESVKDKVMVLYSMYDYYISE